MPDNRYRFVASRLGLATVWYCAFAVVILKLATIGDDTLNPDWGFYLGVGGMAGGLTLNVLARRLVNWWQERKEIADA
jgi:hypothetical protein